MSDVDSMSDADDRVTLTTVHLAKGLEYDIVFMAGLEEGVFPLASSYKSQDEIEEERRLFYVAVTRAKKKLFLSHAGSKVIYGQLTYLRPSRFIEESSVTNIKAALPKEETFDVSTASVSNEDNFEDGPWKVGESVKHPSFGVGTITSASGRDEDFKVVIRFSDGKARKLYVKYANLEKV